MTRAPRATDRIFARLLRTRWFVRLPIPLFRAGLGWVLGRRLVMIEHMGRVSSEPRFVVLEVVERRSGRFLVASGFGPRAQWYRNLRANQIAYVSTGRTRRIRAEVRFLGSEEAGEALAAYARDHPLAYDRLAGAMEIAQGAPAVIPLVEFTPRRP